MIERITDLPDNVLGFRASGEVTGNDYQTVLVPAIEERLRKHKRVRLLYVLGDDFKSYSGAAAWEDAKVGLRHLTRFERVAFVTDVGWVESAIKAFGFVIPGEVRIFSNEGLPQAREWVSKPPSAGTLTFEFMPEESVLILRPQGDLVAADFERISGEIDPHIAKKGALRGVLIAAEHFPGWDDLGALSAHLRFVKDHRKQVKRLAIVTDDRVLSAMPFLASHFVVPEARHFSMDENAEALSWVSQG